MKKYPNTKENNVTKDPVCGMQVDEKKATAKNSQGGQTYYFCCDGCLNKFKAAPEKYIKKETK